MLKSLTVMAIGGFTLMALASAASAQIGAWEGEVDPNGRVVYDQWGNQHYVPFHATDGKVDIYGNVISTDTGMLDPSIDFGAVTTYDPYAPVQDYGYQTPDVPYPDTDDSHEKFINSIYE